MRISQDSLVPLLVVGMLGLMILPLPSIILDLLLAVNITVALAIMLTAMHVRQPLDFSVFPALLLVTTLFRLGLNVSSTRLILLEGHNGSSAAGKVIQTFGEFVVGGNYVVGLVIFLILIIINFVVITKGAGRIAEVGARFTLDALPGKQMSIDSDLASGVLTQEEARAKRTQLTGEADFYGAMDGANKFVRGDAIAGLIITGINIVGGLVIGTVDAGLSLSDAATFYTVLTIGDGLVSQIPSLIIATAAGLVVTRAADGHSMGSQMVAQTLGNKKVLGATAGVVATMSLIPGLPVVPFLGLSAGLLWLRRTTPEPGEETSADGKAGAGANASGGPAEEKMTEEEELQESLVVEPLVLEVGFSLVPLVTRDRGGELLDRIVGLRKRFAKELGILIPPVHLRDSLDIGGGDYRLLLHSVEVASGTVMTDRMMAMNPGNISDEIDGIAAVDPAFGIPAMWITRADVEEAEIYGYTVVEPAAVIATHLSELFREHAAELVGRQELMELIDVVARRHPKLVDELIPNILGYGEVHAVIRNLLSEGVSIRDLRTILEALADGARTSKAAVTLTEAVRRRIGPSIAQHVKEADGKVYAALLDPRCEEALRNCVVTSEHDTALAPDLGTAQSLLGGVQKAVEALGIQGHRPLLVAPADLRYPLWKFVNRFLPQVTVVSQQELPSRMEVQALTTVSLGALNPARSL
ncbi:MAG: flagellar biosynthesis protein FlhA [Myxococcota bacterium]|jgi:flagellar biosynthesis protein FlhA